MQKTDKPPRKFEPRLKSAPKTRQILWCNFPESKALHLPELWKRRPVVVLSRTGNNRLAGTVAVVACSTEKENKNNPWATPVLANGQQSWAICDKITSVAVSRLSLDKRGVVMVSQEEFASILRLVSQWLVKMQ